ncbi:MAG TPA: MoxR family ATPase [Chloroflexota bacterium]|nr:MoxR family ATPase [Chloroflexota bacterium]
MTEIVEATRRARETVERLKEEAHSILIGQEEVFELLCVALLSQGHVLLEGVPGTAKTLMAKLLSRLLALEFRRIQFTPDLMPSDIVGTSVFDVESSRFFLKRGPIFTQVLLADEINRAPAKTQSALLEAMEERQVTIEGERQPLGFPFFVVATQNPVEYEGTYPLPEAQLDRFLFKLRVTYPGQAAECTLLEHYGQGFDPRDLDSLDLPGVLDADGLRELQTAAAAVTVDASILTYITGIVEATRSSPDLLLGASPRASVALFLSSRVLAILRGRDYVIPDDVKALAPPVLRHRLMLKAEAEIEGVTADTVVERTLARVEVPR